MKDDADISPQEVFGPELPEFIRGELYNYTSVTYDYLIRARGWGQYEFQSARQAYGLENPGFLMGWEIDPATNKLGSKVIIRDYMVIEVHKKPTV